VSLSRWRAATGRSSAMLEARLSRARQKGLLVKDADRLQASPQGLLFLNDLLALIGME